MLWRGVRIAVAVVASLLVCTHMVGAVGLPVGVISGPVSYADFQERVLRAGEDSRSLEPVVLRMPIMEEDDSSSVLHGWRRAFGWTRLQLMQLCGDADFEAWHYQMGAETWGGLTHGGPHNVRWYLEHMLGGTRCHNTSAPFGGGPSKEVCTAIEIPRAKSGEKLFLHEQPVCSLCPKIALDFNILRYWSTNHLHDVAPDPKCGTSPLTESFPAITIAPNQTGVGLRQAHHGAATWLAVVHGSKKVRLYPPRDAHHLHASGCSHPGSTEFNMCKSVKVDAFDPDHNTFPRFAQVEPYEIDLKPGDVLWIPSSWFYQDLNTGKFNVALMGEYVDHHNHEQVKSYAKLIGRNDIRVGLGLSLKAAGGEPSVRPETDAEDMTLEEYLGYSCPLGPECRHSMCGTVKRDDIIGWFQSFDANKNGVLDKDESRGDTNLEQIFTSVDRNGDQYITFKEVCAYEELKASEKHWRDRDHSEL